MERAPQGERVLQPQLESLGAGLSAGLALTDQGAGETYIYIYIYICIYTYIHMIYPYTQSVIYIQSQILVCKQAGGTGSKPFVGEPAPP